MKVLAFNSSPKMEKGNTEVLQAAGDAGRQLVESGEISEETLRLVSRELLPRDMYRQIANGQFEQALKQLERKGIAA